MEVDDFFAGITLGVFLGALLVAFLAGKVGSGHVETASPCEITAHRGSVSVKRGDEELRTKTIEAALAWCKGKEEGK